MFLLPRNLLCTKMNMNTRASQLFLSNEDYTEILNFVEHTNVFRGVFIGSIYLVNLHCLPFLAHFISILKCNSDFRYMI